MGEWADQAACKGMRIFFPTQAGPGYNPRMVREVAAAKAVCAGCSVREDCLAHATATNETRGIWGGLTASERGRLAGRPTRQPPPIKHGTYGGYIAHIRRGIEPCDGCRAANASYHRRRAADRRYDALVALSSCSPQDGETTVMV